MADKVAAAKEVVEATKEKCEKPEKVEKAKPEEVVAENGDAENGDAKETAKDTTDKAENGSDACTIADKCAVKRKSTAGEEKAAEGDEVDAAKEEKKDGATPEKKAKLDETVETETKTESKAAA